MILSLFFAPYFSDNSDVVESHISEYGEKPYLDDVRDGSLHKSEFPFNPDENRTYIISVTWNIDGLTAVKSLISRFSQSLL